MKHIFYYIVFFSWYLLSLLPLRVLYLLSDLLYFPLYYCIRYRRRIVRKNLTESFPEKDIQEIVRIEKDFYSYFCDYVVETIKLISMSEKQMRKRMTFGGIDAVSKILQEKSCITMIGHYCNWEWITSLPLHLNQEIISAQIYHELENPAFDSLFLHLRSRFKAVNLEMMNALRQIIIYKKENKRSIIGFIADQAPNWNSINLWTDFLNHKTAVFTGGERIAKSTNSAVLYLDITRVKRGYYHAEFIVMTETPKDFPDHTLTVDYAHLLEQTIRRAPQYWLWSHNRWKRTYEDYLRREEQG